VGTFMMPVMDDEGGEGELDGRLCRLERGRGSAALDLTRVRWLEDSQREANWQPVAVTGSNGGWG
jgi:hypothetical protein